MKANIPDTQQTQKAVELWTPWGVLHVARDDSMAARRRPWQAERRLPAAAKPAIHHLDLTPRV